MRILKANLILFFGTILVTLSIYFLTTPSSLSGRNPAQFENSATDFENIKQLKQQIISTLKISKKSNDEFEVSISLPSDICQHYQNFVLTLEAEGVAINGEPLEVIKTKTCSDLNTENLSMTWPVGRPDQPALLDQPIRIWNIKSLFLKPNSEAKPIRISSYEIIFVLGAPASIEI